MFYEKEYFYKKRSYIYLKCRYNQYEMIWADIINGNLAYFFSIANKKFNAVSCIKCGYTEFYRYNPLEHINCADDDND